MRGSEAVDSDDLLGKVFSAAAGTWAIFLAVVVAIFKGWPAIMGRLNERRRDAAAEEAGDWARIRAERDQARAERDRIHALWIKCEEEKMAALSRAVTAEAALQGIGRAREEAAAIVAVERLHDAAKTNGPKGGGK